MPAVRGRLSLGTLRDVSATAGGIARALARTQGRRSHPQVDGEFRAEGLHGLVEILRDRQGVPHVFAAGEAGALYGQGFVHAQDRLAQVDLMRRLAAGRIAEAVGPRGLESDRFMRRLGLADRAARDVERASAEELQLLEAYANGFNAGVASHRTLPPEFAALRVRPARWRVEHTMLIGRLLMFSFATNWDTELLRERLLRAVGPERAALLDPGYPPEARTASGVPAVEAVEALARAYEAAARAGLRAAGASNAWALSGSRSTTGSPLLAADPHLKAGIPGLFHVSHIRGGDIDVIGASVPGLPGIILGHNSAVAWGVTAGLADVSDCYVETVDSPNPARYRTPEGWSEGRLRRERIEVRGAPAVEELVLETRHGPILGPAIPGGAGRGIALRSTTLEPGETIGPLLDMCRAPDIEAFEAALRRWPGATFNVVFASRDGHIGYRLAGEVPARGPAEGLLPQEGATSPGPPPPRPPGELPALRDPAEGAIVSANEAPGGAQNLGSEWCEPWRATRIEERLAARPVHDLDSLRRIQLDLYSAPLVRLRDLVLARGAIDDLAVAGLLAAWDGQVAASSAAAALIECIYQQLARAVVFRLAGEAAPLILGEGLGPAAPYSSFHYRLQGPLIAAIVEATAPWVDGVLDRDRLLAAAVASSIRSLRAELGDEPAEWAWGRLHRLHLDHPLAALPLVGARFSRGPFPAGGDVNTVWQGGYTVHAGPDGRGGFSPAYRQLLDLDDWDRSRFQLPAGNSGIPGHPRYDDCTVDFLAGRDRPLHFTRPAIEGDLEHRLTLVPG